MWARQCRIVSTASHNDINQSNCAELLRALAIKPVYRQHPALADQLRALAGRWEQGLTRDERDSLRDRIDSSARRARESQRLILLTPSTGDFAWLLAIRKGYLGPSFNAVKTRYKGDLYRMLHMFAPKLWPADTKEAVTLIEDKIKDAHRQSAFLPKSLATVHGF